MDITIFVNMVSSCHCCSNKENHAAARCISFIEGIRKDLPGAKIQVLQECSEEFKELKILKGKRKRIKMPVVLLDGKVLSIGRYPTTSDILTKSK